MLFVIRYLLFVIWVGLSDDIWITDLAHQVDRLYYIVYWQGIWARK